MDKVQLEIHEFETKIRSYQEKGLKIFASSSFQTHSIPMLHIISQIDKTIPIYFLDTGFHFPETISYRNLISEKYQLKLIALESPISKLQQLNSNKQFHFISNPDYCCYLNKVLPIEGILPNYNVWISGIRGDQSNFRKSFEKEEEGKFDSIRYHPMLNWDKKMIWNHIYQHDIPHHPLDKKGYASIGCEPCTSPPIGSSNERLARWEGMEKKECGLHIDLVQKKAK